jgi:hypothetical protein
MCRITKKFAKTDFLDYNPKPFIMKLSDRKRSLLICQGEVILWQSVKFAAKDPCPATTLASHRRRQNVNSNPMSNGQPFMKETARFVNTFAPAA